MTEQYDEEIEEENLPVKQEPVQELSFLIDQKKHNLTKAHKAIDKEVMTAIEFLGSVVKDEEKSTEVRMKAAEKILDSKLKIADQQNKEWLQRVVAESRKNMLTNTKSNFKNVGGSDDDEDDSPTPVYRPDIILDISNVNKL